MDYEIYISESRHYIVFRPLQPMTAEIGQRGCPEVTRLGAEKNINRFLFDMRGSANIESVSNNFYFARKDIVEFGFPHASRSAFLVDANDTSHEFITTVFLNTGYIVKLFKDESTAINWLEESTNK